MKKIDESIREDKLSDYQKVKRQVREAKGTDKDVQMRLLELRQRHFTSNFKSYSRDRRNVIFSSKTNPPPVGQYHPKKEVVQHRGRDPHFDPHHVTAEEAYKVKFDCAKSKIKVTPKILEHISPRRPNFKHAVRGATSPDNRGDQSPDSPKPKNEKVDSQVSTDKLKGNQSKTLEQ